MKRIIFMLVFVIAGACPTSAQDVVSIVDKARELRFTNTDSSILLAKQALKKLKAKPDKFQETRVYNILGSDNWILGNYNEADSMFHISLHIATRIKNDTMVVIIYNNLGLLNQDKGDFERAYTMYSNALRRAKKINRYTDIADTYNNLGALFQNYGYGDSCLYYYQLGVDNYKKETIRKTMAESGAADLSTNMGNVHFSHGKYTLALKNYYFSLRTYEKTKEWNKAAIVSNCIAEIFFDKRDAKKVKYYCSSALRFTDKEPHAGTRGNTYFILGKSYQEDKNPDSACICYLKAIDAYKSIGNLLNISTVYNSLATVYIAEKKYEEAKQLLEKAYDDNMEMADTAGACVNLFNLTDLYLAQNFRAKAAQCNAEAIAMLTPGMYYTLYVDLYAQAADIAAMNGDYKKAYEYLQRFNLYNDSLRNENTQKDQAELEAIFQTERKDAQIKLLNTDASLRKTELAHSQEVARRKSTQLYAMMIGAALMLVLVGVVVRNNIQRKKINKDLAQKNEVITLQKEKVERQHEELEHKNLIIEEKNKEITDSINYAKRIQDAVLRSESVWKATIQQHFIFFRPKDIVSGDFYWLAPISAHEYIYATADCTGHGVPGGFMTMLGTSFLNDVVNEKGIHAPAKILEELRQRIITSLKQTGVQGENKDGMDIVLCKVNTHHMTLTYASANNAFYIVRNGKLMEQHPDKQPIGYFANAHPFSEHTISIEKGDTIYTFTDGYADQFGGPKGKKFKYKNLEELLIKNAELSLAEQCNSLENTIIEWMGDMEQLDDMLIIGIKIV